MTDTTTGAKHLTDADFTSTIQSAGKPVMVDFYATWCGPCKLAAPIIDRLSAEYADKVMIVKLDVDENHATSQAYDVRSIPTVIIFNAEGEEIKELDRKIGFPGEQGYRQMLERVAA